ncbi:MAG TPA: cupin domain-containing protein [Acidimicrobiales bacterium]|nr:cupin domain-containing protein [Acidimicrobiales bacterium]
MTASVERRRFDDPDETRRFLDKGRTDVVRLGGQTIGRLRLEPGWVWSEHVGPALGTTVCRESHLRYVISGRMAVTMEDGTEVEFAPGDLVSIPPGHDGRTVGDEPCVLLDLTGLGHDREPS